MSTKFIELYSGNRNREQYPLASSYEVPFAPTMQNITPERALDPVIDGAIYYSFTLTPFSLTSLGDNGVFQSGSKASSPILDPNQSPGGYSLIADYYVGFYIIYNSEKRVILSYDPSTGIISLDEPFSSLTVGGSYSLYKGFPTSQYLYIPAIDNNNNTILNFSLAYNGYYIVFETPNPNYSNADNSNIFYRKISYYDYKTRIAYFDTPLPFSYNTPYLISTPQTFTLRKTLPTERWVITTPTFYNSVYPVNPLIGPLVGNVITLSNNASSVDNFYKGKYVYFSSNAPDTYSPPYPNPYNLSIPLPNFFYPVYGNYYIKAYNGSTRQLSICNDINGTIPLPTFKNLGYNSSSFVAGTGITSITNTGGTTYQAVLSGPPPLSTYTITLNGPIIFKAGITYTITMELRTSTNISDSYLSVNGSATYVSPSLTSAYQTFTFTTIQIQDTNQFSINFIGTQFVPMSMGPYYIEWDSFSMIEEDTIDIVTFNRDNFTPLSYNGSMVSQNQTVCYEVSLITMTLPNLPLITGSSIAFYPFVYVELANATSPSGSSDQIIYSNNPKSNRALFVAPVGNVSNPNLQAFVYLTGGNMKQTIKFKPNDNLRFSVYLPDGAAFQPLSPDTLSPYPPNISTQIDAVFSVKRLDSNERPNFTIL